MGHAKIFQKLLVGGRFFERSEVGSLQVLDQGFGQGSRVVARPDHRRDLGEAGASGRPPPSLPRHQSVAAVRVASQHHRLENTNGSDRVGQRGQ